MLQCFINKIQLILIGEKMFKKIIPFLISLFLTTVVIAKDIDVIIPNPAGSTTDILAKALSESYNKITGDNLVIQYAPGGDGAVAAVKFQNANNETLLLGITSLHIYNPALKQDLPYKDSDFKYISFIGYNPGFYISNPSSGIQTIEDLLNKLNKSDKPFIGGYAVAWNVNINILKNKNKLDKKIQIVGHKGAPDVILNVLNGSVPVGIVAVTNNLFELAKEGKINIIGTTHHEDMDIEGIKIPSVGKKLNLTQTTGGFIISMKPNADPKFAENVEKNIVKTLQSKEMQKSMEKYNIFPANIFGSEATEKRINDFRQTVKENID